MFNLNTLLGTINEIYSMVELVSFAIFATSLPQKSKSLPFILKPFFGNAIIDILAPATGNTFG